MNYIVFDLEWNQPLDDASHITNPLYLDGEIIEIGAVKLDDSFCFVGEKKFYIRPQFYKRLHKQIISLTKITEKTLETEGQFFPEAFAAFEEWCGEDYSFMTWSLRDTAMLVQNMQLHGISTEQLPDCIDIQRIFAHEIMRDEKRISLDHALEIINVTGDPAHDALHDARNTVKICDHLELDQYIDEYRSRPFADTPNTLPYSSYAEAIREDSLLRFSCPWCRTEVTVDRWIKWSPDTYMGYGKCEEGDEFLVELTLYQRSNQEYYVQRMFYEMNDDFWDLYQMKKNALPV